MWKAWPISTWGITWRGVEEFYVAVAAPFRFEFLSPATRSALGFAVRTWVASLCALYIAFFLQFDSPYWAALTVWIVSSPNPGMVLSKSLYRLLGTVIGVVMGIVLISLFAQSPELFLLAFALWMGGCTVVANLLRNFRSYAGILAGFTAAIIALGSIDHPTRVFDIAMARGSCTVIAISCAMMVTSLFAPHRARAEVRARLNAVLGDAARRAAFPMATVEAEGARSLEHKLITDLIAIETQIEFAAAESPEFRIHADKARSILAELFGVVSASSALEALEAREGRVNHVELIPLREEISSVLVEIPRMLASDQPGPVVEDLRRLREKLAQLNPEADAPLTQAVVTERVAIDRAHEILLYLENGVVSWRALLGHWEAEPRLRLDFHRDQRQAWINGLRTMLSVLVAGTFWIATAWSSGASLLIQLSAIVSIYSTMPRPGGPGLQSFIAITCAALCGLPCLFLLAHVDGIFVFFGLVMALFWIPGGMLMANPKYAVGGTFFCALLPAMVQPLNPMVYDVAGYLNNSLALVMGSGFGVLPYFLFMPWNVRSARRYVEWRMRLGLKKISVMNPAPPAWLWQTRNYDRVYRFYDFMPKEQKRTAWVDVRLGVLNLGNEILRLRSLLNEPSLPRETAVEVKSVVRSFGGIVKGLPPVVNTVQAGFGRLRALAAPEGLEARRTQARVLGALREMDAFLATYPPLLTP